MGLIFSGSPPSRLTASLMAAKSTTAGTPLQETTQHIYDFKFHFIHDFKFHLMIKNLIHSKSSTVP